MKITEHTPSVLVLQVREYIVIFEAILPGLVFLLGIIIILRHGTLKTITCERIERSQINCEFTSSGLLGTKTSEIDQIQSAEVELRSFLGNDFYRIAFITKNSKVSIPFGDSDADIVNKRVNRIKIFIKEMDDPSFKIEVPNCIYFPRINGGIYILAGAAYILFIILRKSLISCSFDKSLDRLCLEYEGPFLQSSDKVRNLNVIKEVKADKAFDHDGDVIYKLKLILKSGESISLGSESNHPEIATTINEFLGIDV